MVSILNDTRNLGLPCKPALGVHKDLNPRTLPRGIWHRRDWCHRWDFTTRPPPTRLCSSESLLRKRDYNRVRHPAERVSSETLIPLAGVILGAWSETVSLYHRSWYPHRNRKDSECWNNPSKMVYVFLSIPAIARFRQHSETVMANMKNDFFNWKNFRALT